MTLEIWTGLLRQVGPAHHAAFASTDGEDPDWPRWYAAWLLDHLPAQVRGSDDLAELLAAAAAEYSVTSNADDWPAFYARFIVDRLED